MALSSYRMSCAVFEWKCKFCYYYNLLFLIYSFVKNLTKACPFFFLKINFSSIILYFQTWITYAAITFYTNDYYGNNNAALLFNTIFMILSIPVGFFACWWIDRFGLRSAVSFFFFFNFDLALPNFYRVVKSR